ncbi:phosphate transport system ATP-binding protein [Arachidicoccus rhizosphaerae]|uniref:Phosphate transport system ATP-binding protein n=1 Tax=Arachidicoccus rhizosphaerae TaxID=551991 RepID=A0A1H3XPK9_9BACT|nr:phosphate ABC transporter ATP-binding protein [Arachidicoccus rhizosphaerae]SEA01309.1 phosphate transport system ATP-binding protein [Arachidicoccus rhizosphaerae]
MSASYPIPGNKIRLTESFDAGFLEEPSFKAGSLDADGQIEQSISTPQQNAYSTNDQKAPAILSIKNFNVQAAGSTILKNINLEIPKGKITVLLGPSGCGKTTLLKCLNRLSDLHPSLKVNGKILIDGEDIFHPTQDLTKIRQKMGLLSQRPFPLPMSIYKNIAYGLKIKGIRDKKVIKEKVEKHLKDVGLWEEVKDRLHGPAARLSIGQQQRLCLARGLAVGPEIILADEPTSALDPISSRKIEEEFLRLKEDYTLIVVTHILRQARRLADHIVFMYFGEVIEQGTPDEIFNHPKSDILKQYLQSGH